MKITRKVNGVKVTKNIDVTLNQLQLVTNGERAEVVMSNITENERAFIALDGS